MSDITRWWTLSAREVRAAVRKQTRGANNRTLSPDESPSNQRSVFNFCRSRTRIMHYREKEYNSYKLHESTTETHSKKKLINKQMRCWRVCRANIIECIMFIVITKYYITEVFIYFYTTGIAVSLFTPASSQTLENVFHYVHYHLWPVMHTVRHYVEHSCMSLWLFRVIVWFRYWRCYFSSIKCP